MKKNLMVMAAVMFGILLAFASCKDKKSSNDDEEDEEDTEQVDKKEAKKTKKAEALKKVSSLDDIEALSEAGLDEVDLSNLDFKDIDLKDIDLDNLTEDQANTLLELVVTIGNRQLLPMNLGNGMKMTDIEEDGRDVVFNIEMDHQALNGATMSDMQTVFDTPDLREMMMSEMIGGLEKDEGLQIFIKVILASNKNFTMRYIDTSNYETAICRLTASELRRMQ